MAVFLIDVAWTGLVDLVVRLGISAVEKSTTTAARSFQETGAFWDDRKQLEANIQAVFGDSLSKELIDLKHFMEATIQDASRSIQSSTVEQALFIELNPVLHKTQMIYEAFCYYIESPTVDFRKREFQRACKKHEPHGIITFLHQQIKQGQFGDTLLDRIAVACQAPRNVDKFELWRKRIECILLMACFLRAFDLRLKLEDGREKSAQRTTSSLLAMEDHSVWGRLAKHVSEVTAVELRRSVNLEELYPTAQDEMNHTISLELQNLDKKRSDIMDEFSKASARFKCHFLFQTCGDRKHGKCGASNDAQCCLLGAHVYGFLRDNAAVKINAGQALATNLANSLKEKWPKVHWATVISGNVEVKSIDKSKVWFHSQGTERGSTVLQGRKLVSEKLPQSSNPALGCLHRYRRRTGVKLSEAVVFWADSAEIEAVENERVMFVKELLVVDQPRRAFSSFRKSEPSVKDKLDGETINGVGPVFNVMFRSVMDWSRNFHWEEPVGVEKADVERGRTYPIYVWQKSGPKSSSTVTMIWPEKSSERLRNLNALQWKNRSNSYELEVAEVRSRVGSLSGIV